MHGDFTLQLRRVMQFVSRRVDQQHLKLCWTTVAACTTAHKKCAYVIQTQACSTSDCSIRILVSSRN